MAIRERDQLPDAPPTSRAIHIVQILHGLVHELEQELGMAEHEGRPEVFPCSDLGVAGNAPSSATKLGHVAPQASQTDASATKATQVSQNSGEAETLAAEVPGQGEEEASTPPSAGDELATNEQWTAMLRHVAKSTAAVFRKAHKRFPDAGLTQALDITREQAEILIGEALK